MVDGTADSQVVARQLLAELPEPVRALIKHGAVLYGGALRDLVAGAPPRDFDLSIPASLSMSRALEVARHACQSSGFHVTGVTESNEPYVRTVVSATQNSVAMTMDLCQHSPDADLDVNSLTLSTSGLSSVHDRSVYKTIFQIARRRFNLLKSDLPDERIAKIGRLLERGWSPGEIETGSQGLIRKIEEQRHNAWILQSREWVKRLSRTADRESVASIRKAAVAESQSDAVAFWSAHQASAMMTFNLGTFAGAVVGWIAYVVRPDFAIAGPLALLVALVAWAVGWYISLRAQQHARGRVQELRDQQWKLAFSPIEASELVTTTSISRTSAASS